MYDGHTLSVQLLSCFLVFENVWLERCSHFKLSQLCKVLNPVLIPVLGMLFYTVVSPDDSCFDNDLWIFN